MKNMEYSAQFCVIGGGMAGLCAAIAASRHGISTVLMHDRSVLGGNASSEIRMWICGAHGDNMRETGIIEEIMLENFYKNPERKYPLWDATLYDIAYSEPNLKLILNCTCMQAKTKNKTISSVTGWQLNSETYYTIKSDYFADCSGDSILSTLTGAEFMQGRESKRDFSETIPPDERDMKTMGMSCLFQIRETDHKTNFIPPKWAYVYDSDDDLPKVVHNQVDNFWWIEVGGTKDAIHDTDECREELLKISYGVWDHMKNKGSHGFDNWELEWIGFLPGKRESRRYVGKYIVTQNDVESSGKFDDIVAYGGWTMDDHFPEGFYYRGGYPTINHPAPSPWGIPFRALYSNNINNLLFAGRNISVTHAALSSSRVMATCSLLGQAIGVGVFVALSDGTSLSDTDISKIQKLLMNEDCYLPGIKREILNSSSSAVCSSDIVTNGIDRGDENMWKGHHGDSITYTFKNPEYIETVKLIFDSFLNRDYQNMPCAYPLVEDRFFLPKSIIKEYTIRITDDKSQITDINIYDNHQRLMWHKIQRTVTKLEFIPKKTWGLDEFHLFSFEFENKFPMTL